MVFTVISPPRFFYSQAHPYMRAKFSGVRFKLYKLLLGSRAWQSEQVTQRQRVSFSKRYKASFLFSGLYEARPVACGRCIRDGQTVEDLVF